MVLAEYRARRRRVVQRAAGAATQDREVRRRLGVGWLGWFAALPALIDLVIRLFELFEEVDRMEAVYPGEGFNLVERDARHNPADLQLLAHLRRAQAA